MLTMYIQTLCLLLLFVQWIQLIIHLVTKTTVTQISYNIAIIIGRRIKTLRKTAKVVSPLYIPLLLLV